MFIPLRYVLHHDGDDIILNGHITHTVDVDHYRNKDGIIVAGLFVVKSRYMIELPDRSLELIPLREGPEEDSPFEGFHFTGFIDSCKQIIKMLDMPEDTLIH